MKVRLGADSKELMRVAAGPSKKFDASRAKKAIKRAEGNLKVANDVLKKSAVLL